MENIYRRLGARTIVNAKGVRIYHMPGQQAYDDTRINLAKGEQWFCSEVEAQAVGWRKALR